MQSQFEPKGVSPPEARSSGLTWAQIASKKNDNKPSSEQGHTEAAEQPREQNASSTGQTRVRSTLSAKRSPFDASNK